MYLYKSFYGSDSSRRIPPRTTYQKIYEVFFYVESRERFVKFILCTGAILFFITRIFRGLARTWNTLCIPVNRVLQNAGYIEFIGNLLFGGFLAQDRVVLTVERRVHRFMRWNIKSGPNLNPY